MENVTNDIKEAIEKALPALAAKSVVERLARADELEGQCEALKSKLKDALSTASELRDKVRDQDAVDSQLNLNIAERDRLEGVRRELADEQAQTEVVGLKYQIAAEQRTTEIIKEVAMGLVRNTDYRKSAFTANTTVDQYGIQTTVPGPSTEETATTA